MCRKTATVVNEQTQGSHTFSYAFVQDFSRSKLRFSRAVICSKKGCRSLYDHLSFQEKYSVIISYAFFKDFQDFSTTFFCLLFSMTFPGLEIYFFIFQVRGNPETITMTTRIKGDICKPTGGSQSSCWGGFLKLKGAWFFKM